MRPSFPAASYYVVRYHCGTWSSVGVRFCACTYDNAIIYHRELLRAGTESGPDRVFSRECEPYVPSPSGPFRLRASPFFRRRVRSRRPYIPPRAFPPSRFPRYSLLGRHTHTARPETKLAPSWIRATADACTPPVVGRRHGNAN